MNSYHIRKSPFTRIRNIYDMRIECVSAGCILYNELRRHDRTHALSHTSTQNILIFDVLGRQIGKPLDGSIDFLVHHQHAIKATYSSIKRNTIHAYAPCRITSPYGGMGTEMSWNWEYTSTYSASCMSKAGQLIVLYHMRHRKKKTSHAPHIHPTHLYRCSQITI